MGQNRCPQGWLRVRVTSGVAIFGICATIVTATPGPTTASVSNGNGVIQFPAARYPVDLESDVRVPMRDGVGLYADIYRPRGAGKRLPTILIRTPYSKAPYRQLDWKSRHGVAYMFASQGFVVIVQDMRGRFRSEGKYVVAGKVVMADDGYDTVAWIAAQPWSNGKVGGYGCSELGNAQMMMAPSRPPALAAIVPQGASGSLRNYPDENQQFGIPLVSMLPWFIGIDPGYSPTSALGKLPPEGSEQPQLADKVDPDQLVRTLPVADMADRAGLKHPDGWRDWMTRAPGDPWFRQLPFIDEHSRPDVPALFVTSWYDNADPALELFNRLRTQSTSDQARRNQYVIVSATAHCKYESAQTPYIAGQRDVGDTRRDYWSIYLRWYDHWLRGTQNAINMPHVQYYVMGTNRWKSAESWPLPGTRFVPYYFRSAGRANTSHGDGGLSAAMATGPADRYRYDPADPTPDGEIWNGSNDLRKLDLRSDRLVFTSHPLRSGLEVTGPLRAVLYVSSSALDTDFVVQLSDVYPDGRVYNLSQGVVRARYRDAYAAPTTAEEDYTHPSLLKPGKIYRIEMKLGATANWFGPGHRIRVQIASALFPLYARNLNTGGNNATESAMVIAENKIYHDRDHASHIILPVVAPR